jgi:superfamily I DNA/RNA helicase
VQLLMQFLYGAAHDLRFSLGSCAVLCPTNDSGRALAVSLKRGGIEASFMESKDLDLSWRGVKVLTLNSAKGLEFPIVGLAGFSGSRYALATAETEKEEGLARMRRTLFVGMTRAMRALLVTVPTGTASPLLTGFDARYWHIKNAATSSIIAGDR